MCGVRARRGALFLRVRDELRMTLDSLQVAYQSSLAYGVRHALECEQARGQMAEQIRALCAHHNTRLLLLVLKDGIYCLKLTLWNKNTKCLGRG